MGIGEVRYEGRRDVLAAGVLAAWCQCTCSSGGGSIDRVRLCVSPNVALTVLLDLDRRTEREAVAALPPPPCFSTPSTLLMLPLTAPCQTTTIYC